MADARLKALFKRAAEIAEQVPEEFQEAAFHRALDVLVGSETTREAQGYSEFLDDAAREAQQYGLPIAVAKMALDKSFDVLNLATGVLGIEALSAEQVTRVLNEGYGFALSNEMVARTLESADGLVSRVRRGGNTLYRIIQPGRSTKKKSGVKNKATTAQTGRSKHAASTKKSSPTKKKSASSGGRKKKISPREMITGLIKSGFFNSARSVADILLYFQRKGIEITTRELSAILLRLLQAGLLQRTQSPKGRYKYYTAD